MNTMREQSKKEKQMQIILLIYCVVSFIGIALIKYFRTLHLELTPTMDFLQGTLPNFFAATLLGSCLFNFINHRGFLKLPWHRVLRKRQIDHT